MQVSESLGEAGQRASRSRSDAGSLRTECVRHVVAGGLARWVGGDVSAILAAVLGLGGH